MTSFPNVLQMTELPEYDMILEILSGHPHVEDTKLGKIRLK